MRSVITPLVYIWVNIDTRGCIKSPEKPKDSWGEFNRIPTPGSDRVKPVQIFFMKFHLTFLDTVYFIGMKNQQPSLFASPFFRPPILKQMDQKLMVVGPGRRIIESILFGAKPVRTSVQT